MNSSINLHETYLHLSARGESTLLAGGAAFWNQTPEVMNQICPDYLVATFRYSDTWQQWEVHPQGDEVVSVLSGDIELILDQQPSPLHIKMGAGDTYVIPKNVWHRAVVHVPGDVLHITYGKGTSQRPCL